MDTRQEPPMLFNPFSGNPLVSPSEPGLWRDFFCGCWTFNPWTGAQRKAADVAADPFMHLVITPADQAFLHGLASRPDLNNG